MILETLEVQDFRVFSGLHKIDLSPRVKYRKSRPVVLFGGLNGAGKTSILSAIRLVLYGRMALGKSSTQREYRNYLEDCIHRNPDSDAQPKEAAISLAFQYSHLGEVSRYCVRRSWDNEHESLVIDKDGEIIEGINYQQSQAFLNELVPIGVSDLFFFDGEKIAALAETGNHIALGEALKRLIGLDLIEKLRSDLSIYARKTSADKSSQQQRADLKSLETKLHQAKAQAEAELSNYQQLRASIAELDALIHRTESELLEAGGAWSQGRAKEQARLDDLIQLCHTHETEARALISSALPIAFAPRAIKRLSSVLKAEAEIKKTSHQYSGAKEFSAFLLTQFNDIEPVKVKQALNNYMAVEPSTESVFLDVSERDAGYLEAQANRATLEAKESEHLKTKIADLRHQISQLSENLERAPEESRVERYLEEIRTLNIKRSERLAEKALATDRHRASLKEAIVLTKEIISVTELIEAESDTSRAENYASACRALLLEFSDKLAQEKVLSLQAEFHLAFARLARKDDLSLQVKIDPKSYQVLLQDNAGNSIPQSALSAGERQIYAVAMLDALAKTSGRNLPIIIDTPLGRLDSQHRRKLVENYFPHASHQVVILSTDTEIDKNYFDDLSKHLSHSYELKYDGVTQSSSLQEGYFWRKEQAK